LTTHHVLLKLDSQLDIARLRLSALIHDALNICGFVFRFYL
jgi:hypothetical protein